MNYQRRRPIYSLAAVPVVAALAALSLARAEPLSEARKREPEHLVPVDPYPGFPSYMEEVRGRLGIAHSRFFLQMTVRPSLQPEFAVWLHGGNEDPKNFEKDESDINATERVFITCAMADKNIWFASTTKPAEQKEEVLVKTATKEFPKALALRLQRLWQRMLLQTRYPVHPTPSWHDGITYEFAVPGQYGETITPTEKLAPRLFAELGETLFFYARLSADKKPEMLGSVESAATKLEQRLEQQAVEAAKQTNSGN
jgi:hypothetical protein